MFWLFKNKMKKYTANYFLKTIKVIKKMKKDDDVVIQFFQRENRAILAGISEVVKLLKKHTKWKKYKIKTLIDGNIINDKEVVLELEGKYKYFGFMENIIDGILARMTSIATNASKIMKAANNKEIIFMGDRSDLYFNQEYDGKAANIGGIKKVVTYAQSKWISEKPIGTMPHALIQMFHGDLIEALIAYKKTIKTKEIIALVDFNNDVINDSLSVANHFKQELKAVRVDTASNMVDKYFDDKKTKLKGVNSVLIKALRKNLDNGGFKYVKIIVSSGINEEKIIDFEKNQTPIDIYGVGSYILKINNYFTADVVKLNGKLLAKKGRKYNPNKNLKEI